MVMTPSELQHIYQASGLSKRAFASALGVSDTAVRGWLKGENISPENERHIRAFGAQTPAPTGSPSLLAPPTARDESGRSSALVPVVADADKQASTRMFGEQRLQLGEHVWLVGMPQSGKTTLALNTVCGFPRFIILDFNGDITLPGVPINATVNRAAQRQIIRVRAVSEKAARAAWCEAIQDGLAMGDLALFLDELAPLTTSVHAPDALYQALTYGRHPNVSVIVISHRPSGIPRIIPAATHHHCYFQMDDEDARNVQRLTGTDWNDIPDEPHAVYYVNKRTRFAEGYDLDRERPAQQAREEAAARAQRALAEQAARQSEIAAESRRIERELASAHAAAPLRASVQPTGETNRETVTLPRTRFDQLQQRSYDEGRRDGRKQAASAQKQLPEHVQQAAQEYAGVQASKVYARDTVRPTVIPQERPFTPLPAAPPTPRPSLMARIVGSLTPMQSAPERPAWPYGDVQPDSPMGIRMRASGRVPGWEM